MQTPILTTPGTTIVTGKGGVGKSTIAAAIAAACSAAGHRTLLVCLSGHVDAARLFTDRPMGFEPVGVATRLWACDIHPETALAEYARQQLRIKLVADRLVNNSAFSQFANAAPGLRDTALLGKIWSLSEERVRGRHRYECIVVDAPATGHGVGMLAIAGLVAKMFPVGPIASQATAIDTFVRDPERLGAVLVSLPEEIPVNETVEFHDALEAQGVAIRSVVVNGVLKQRFTDSQEGELSDLELDDPELQAAVDTARYEAQRRTQQQRQLERLSRFGPLLRTTPFIYTESLQRDHVAGLANELQTKRTASRARKPSRV